MSALLRYMLAHLSHHLIAIFLIFKWPVYENNKESVVEFRGVPNLWGMHVSPHAAPWEKNKKVTIIEFNLV